jgi:hypothetical protein
LVTRVTWQVPHVEQELLTVLEQLGLPPIFRGVRIVLSLLFCVVFCRSYCLSFCPFWFGHCIVCPSIYDFWLPIRYDQTFLTLWVPNDLTLWVPNEDYIVFFYYTYTLIILRFVESFEWQNYHLSFIHYHWERYYDCEIYNNKSGACSVAPEFTPVLMCSCCVARVVVVCVVFCTSLFVFFLLTILLSVFVLWLLIKYLAS